MDLIDTLVNLVDSLDPTVFMPELNTVLGWVVLLTKLLLLAPPILLLAFGLWYWLKPPKEANHVIGYRFYLGMGSVEAWQFTQRIAGIFWTVLGGLLLVIVGIVTLTIGAEDMSGMIRTATVWLIIELVLAALCNITINVIVGLRYDKYGQLRNPETQVKHKPHK